MNKLTLGIGSILAGLAVIAGAFASHSLRGYLTDSALSIWQSAVRYQMYHSLALLLVGILMRLEKSVSPCLNTSAITQCQASPDRFYNWGSLIFWKSLYFKFNWY